jgi:hypothetical protein
MWAPLLTVFNACRLAALVAAAAVKGWAWLIKKELRAT